MREASIVAAFFIACWVGFAIWHGPLPGTPKAQELRLGPKVPVGGEEFKWELVTSDSYPTYRAADDCLFVVVDEGMGEPKGTVSCR